MIDNPLLTLPKRSAVQLMPPLNAVIAQRLPVTPADAAMLPGFRV